MVLSDFQFCKGYSNYNWNIDWLEEGLDEQYSERAACPLQITQRGGGRFWPSLALPRLDRGAQADRPPGHLGPQMPQQLHSDGCDIDRLCGVSSQASRSEHGPQAGPRSSGEGLQYSLLWAPWLRGFSGSWPGFPASRKLQPQFPHLRNRGEQPSPVRHC